MKIYTITFHWATNYGAVLQAYALQHYLAKQGHRVQIINYIPRKLRKTFFGCFLSNPKKYGKNFKEWKKERKLRAFRREQLNLTKPYYSHKALERKKWEDATYICGSDQIWNPFFTLQGEGGVTLSYYLDFVPENAKKLSYAASFGTTELNSPVDSIVAGELQGFERVSVREHSALEMLDKIGIKSELVCDPVFLLSKSEWEAMQAPEATSEKQVFKYFLHRARKENEKVYSYVAASLGCKSEKERVLSLGEWLRAIGKAEAVVTNSFHAVAFSVIFHRSFVALVEKGNGMNDRLTTLLGALGLSDRIIDSFDEEELSALLSDPIDWESVDEGLRAIKKSGEKFLEL